MANRQGRNELCACGSGKKFKHCCALKSERTPVGTRIMLSVIALMLLIGALVALRSLSNFDEPLTPRDTILIR
jgi:hypothetical protein